MTDRHTLQLASRQVTAWLVLCVSLVTTLITWGLTERFIRDAVELRLDHQQQQIATGITHHLQAHESVLRGAAGLLTASDDVTRQEWRHYVDGLRLPLNFPSIAALGYMPVVGADDRLAHEAAMRAAGRHGYAIFPADPANRYAPVTLIEPATDNNLQIVGYNMDSDAMRRETMDSARDTGNAAITRGVRLAGDPEGKIAFLMFMPVYSDDVDINSPVSRLARLRGYVFGIVRMDVFMRGVALGDLAHIEVELSERDGGRPSQLLYDSYDWHTARGLEQADEAGLREQVLPVAQREWTLALLMRAGYRTSLETWQPVLIAGGGGAISLFLFVLVGLISGRKAALERQVRETEGLLASAVEAIGEAFVVYDREDRLAFFNEHYREFYNTSAPVIEIGRTFEEIIRYGAEHGQYPAAIGRVDAWVAERLAAHRQGNTELIQRLDDGRWIKIRERLTEDGYIVGFRVDVTELYHAKEAAEAANRAKSQFLATISHEIRTPLNGMLGMAQVLMNPALGEGEREDSARTILRSGQTLLALLNDILDLAKVEAGRFELAPGDFSPRDLVRETIAMFSAAAELKQLRLYWQSALPEDIRLHADALRLRQMLANLLGNAVKFTSHGEIEVDVDWIPDSAQRQLRFVVRDTGIGIPADRLNGLFEPFSQVDGGIARQHGGTGLGLSIVRNLARLMGGDAGVESESGKGSRFWFTVAVEAAKTADVAETVPEPRSLKLAGQVLVVEDDAIHRKVITAAIGKVGATACAVENGRRAVEWIKSGGCVDLILMDLSMPELDGIEATRQIRDWLAVQAQTCPPVVAITANAFPEDRERCAAVGMVDFLAKPINFGELHRIMAKYLLPADDAPGERGAKTLPMPDLARLGALVEQLMPLLAEQKFDAFAVFRELKSVTSGTAIEADMLAVGELLNRMAFDQARDKLESILEQWTIRETQ